MNRLLLCLFLLASAFTSLSQSNYLFVKKGIHKKKTYAQGDRIRLKLHNEQIKAGIITLLRNNFIYVNGEPLHKDSIAAIIVNGKIKKPFPADVETLAWITGGVGLTTLGLTLNNANKPKEALIAASVIGYAPLLIKHFGGRLIGGLKRKQYRVGRKFQLQVFDMYLPPPRSF